MSMPTQPQTPKPGETWIMNVDGRLSDGITPIIAGTAVLIQEVNGSNVTYQVVSTGLVGYANVADLRP